MKQTAVEWLMNNLIERDLVRNETYIKSFLDASLKQAKELEKEQIEDAYSEGDVNGIMNNRKMAEQYYNETFKQL